MDYSYAYNDPEEDYQETQTQTQSTQQASQSQEPPPNPAHLWGYMQPVNNHLVRIDLYRNQHCWTVGRNTTENKIIFPGFKVSNRHALIRWDGTDGQGSVTVHDMSSNGTFINGHKIGKGNTRILRDGNEIAFGTPFAQNDNPMEDYRFIYRHTAVGPPTTGLYAYYDLSSELGKGSFATVMKAMNRATGVWYAVKMIKDKRTPQQQLEQPGGIRSAAVVREISIMEKLKHPNICELKEVFTEEGSSDINLVLELVEGGDLLEYILSRGGLTEDESKHITYQLCLALAYIHSHQIAHRDLKPENVLLTKTVPPKVKVADFGLAKIHDSLTMLRTMCGTPSYLAPEVVKQVNQEGYDSSVDSWSVGVIVFSMLTNSSPFIEDETQRDIRTRIVERTIDWSQLQNRGFSAEVVHFIRSLLQEDPPSRMTLTEALDHPWLQSYTPLADEDYIPIGHPSNADMDDGPDVSAPNGQAGVSHVFHALQIQPSSEHQGNRPLERRSKVLSQAEEGVRSVPEPSQQMIANAEATEKAATRRSKRVRANLTPMQEESDESSSSGGAGQAAAGSSSSGSAPKRRRLRSDK
ncbi:CAMK/RAD53 protein kinase [Coprinopsis sp. MPI-PUGE-AT-0042]|nr:CAMK/RAD53 protein kinase [Coprinopsis sp. MPI-PUGE-AT-0042]